MKSYGYCQFCFLVIFKLFIFLKFNSWKIESDGYIWLQYSISRLSKTFVKYIFECSPKLRSKNEVNKWIYTAVKNRQHGIEYYHNNMIC